jgi:hypothetical protein
MAAILQKKRGWGKGRELLSQPLDGPAVIIKKQF